MALFFSFCVVKLTRNGHLSKATHPCRERVRLTLRAEGSALRTEIDEGTQRSSSECGDISQPVWPAALPAVSRRAGTDVSMGVCAS